MQKAKRVKECFAEYQGKLRLFFLPPHSPELNPDELLWQVLKKNGGGQAYITSAEQLDDRVSHHMKALEGPRRNIRAFF